MSGPASTRFTPMHLILLVTLLFFGYPVYAVEDSAYAIPEIGDPASVVMTPAQERQLGVIILGQVRRSLRVINDPELSAYIQALGTKLVSAGGNTDVPFTFLMVEDPAINAFATPGGVIVIHTGLMLTAKSEAELASVLSHEIAHVTQRHIARNMARQQKQSLKSMLAALAAIFAAIAGSGEASQAILAGSIGASAQSQLNYSRASEQEADRVGIRLLAQAHYDPEAMPRFLERMNKIAQLNTSRLPEFLRTHPITTERISDTWGRAVTYRGSFVDDNQRFQIASARAMALIDQPFVVINEFEAKLRAGKTVRVQDQYGYAVALIENGDTHQAIDVLKQLYRQNKMPNTSLDLAMAQAFIQQGRPHAAIKLLRRVDRLFPRDESVNYYMARALIDDRRPGEALELLEEQTRRYPYNPILDKLRAEAAARDDKPWLSHEAMTDYYMARAQYGSASHQLTLALNTVGMDDVARARLESKRQTLERITDSLKNRH